jgi:hypothetical protein
VRVLDLVGERDRRHHRDSRQNDRPHCAILFSPS